MEFDDFLELLARMAERSSRNDQVVLEFQEGEETKRVPLFGVFRAGRVLVLSACERVSDPRGGPLEGLPPERGTSRPASPASSCSS